MSKDGRICRVVGAAAAGFGALTLISGGAALLSALDMGAVVPFVLWFNTIAGLAYIAAGIGLWQRRSWAFPLSLAIFLATLLVFAALGLHVARGGSFEMRTVFAMALRSAVWGAIALFARQARIGR